MYNVLMISQSKSSVDSRVLTDYLLLASILLGCIVVGIIMFFPEKRGSPKADQFILILGIIIVLFIVVSIIMGLNGSF
jgi:hypothetical protein